MKNEAICAIVSLYTKNEYLARKVALSLPEDTRLTVISEAEKIAECDLALWDTDTLGKAPVDAISLGRGDEARIKVPFSIDALSELISGYDGTLSLSGEKKEATLRKKRIKFTDVEFALLTLLYSAGGKFVSREEILDKIWGGESDGGVINVYIHYLREKLEFFGEKIILSSRKLGYAIDERFISEVEDA